MFKNFNIFSGFRRIAALIAVGMVAVSVADLFSTPYVNVYIQMPFAGKPYVSDDCDYILSATESIDRALSSGQNIHITLCFPASRAYSGEMLIPYRAGENGTVYLAAKYSNEVEQYTSNAARNFMLDESLQASVEQARAAKTSEQHLESLKMLTYWLIGLSILTKAIGWIVRGFLGIPSGLDKRPSASAQTIA